ncbi:MAG: hypothetical protein Q8Q32_02675 [bacterium]|nr:hypothetical protein [bacterium]
MRIKELLIPAIVLVVGWALALLLKNADPIFGFVSIFILLAVMLVYYWSRAFKESLKHDNRDSFKLTDKNSSISLALVAILLYFVFYWAVSSFLRKVSINYRIDPEGWEMLVVIAAAAPAIGFYKIMNFLRNKKNG